MSHCLLPAPSARGGGTMTPNPPPKSRDSAANSRAPPPRHPTIDLPTPTAPILHPTHHPVAPLLPTASHSTPMIPKRVGSTAQPMWGRGGPGVGGGGRCPPLTPPRCHPGSSLCKRCSKLTVGPFYLGTNPLGPALGRTKGSFHQPRIAGSPPGLWGSTTTAHAPQSDPIMGKR